MMAVTHALIAAAGVSLFCQTGDPLILGLGIIGSQIPDLDSTKSLIGQIFFPVSEWLEKRYPHRTATHSILFNLGLIMVSFGLWYFVSQKTSLSIVAAIALPLGHLLAIFSDTFTKKGVQLFYPLPVWCVCGSNPRRRLKTGGNAEFLVIGATVILLLISLRLDYQGGLKNVATEKLNLKDKTAPIVYNQNASKAFIWADFQGYKVGDRQPINEKFLVISEENGYVLMNEESTVYKVGQDVIEEKIKLTVGNAAKVTQVSQKFQDDEVSGILQQLKEDYPNDLVLLSGSLDVDYAEKIKATFPIKISGNKITLEFCNVDEAIAALRDQWAIGELQIKIFTPNPWVIK